LFETLHRKDAKGAERTSLNLNSPWSLLKSEDSSGKKDPRTDANVAEAASRPASIDAHGYSTASNTAERNLAMPPQQSQDWDDAVTQAVKSLQRELDASEEQLIIQDTIGEGGFGKVYSGVLPASAFLCFVLYLYVCIPLCSDASCTCCTPLCSMQQSTKLHLSKRKKKIEQSHCSFVPGMLAYRRCLVEYSVICSSSSRSRRPGSEDSQFHYKARLFTPVRNLAAIFWSVELHLTFMSL
jgi:hypothetical protein